MFDKDDAFALSNEKFLQALRVNLLSAYASLHEAVAGFHSLESSSEPKAFIATGNVLPFFPTVLGVTLGTGKAGLAHLIEIGTMAYKEKNYR